MCQRLAIHRMTHAHHELPFNPSPAKRPVASSLLMTKKLSYSVERGMKFALCFYRVQPKDAPSKHGWLKGGGVISIVNLSLVWQPFQSLEE